MKGPDQPDQPGLMTALLVAIASQFGHRRGKHRPGRISKLAGAKRSRQPERRRLKMARGAGSINCRADALQLCRRGRWHEAADMIEDHRRQCGEQLYSPRVLASWRSHTETA